MKTDKKNKKRICSVCGARVRSWDSRVTTCDGTCVRAKTTGRTRAKQFAYEMKREAEREQFEHVPTVYFGGNLELVNRPYLAAAFA